VPNNPNPIPTSINLSPQQFILTTANIPPTMDALAFANLVGEFFQVLELGFLVKSFEKKLQLTTFSQQKDETLKMFYMRLLKLKEDTQIITNLEATHRYFCLLESTPTLYVKVLQWVFAKFGDSYTLLDVYNISKKLELVHAHYEASTMRPPSCSRLHHPPIVLTRLSHSSSRAKAVHLATPILHSYNYSGNRAHKASECNIPSEDLFCDYCGKEGHHEGVCFAKFPKRKQFQLP